MFQGGVPELVKALCHHLACLHDRQPNFASTRRSLRETLFARYRDVAFSELLGFGASFQRCEKSLWNSPIDGENDIASPLVLGRVKDLLVCRTTETALVVSDEGYSFACSEWEQLYRFLVLLATTFPEDDEQDAFVSLEDKTLMMGRGALLDDGPDVDFIPGLVPLSCESLKRTPKTTEVSPESIPGPRGWFLGDSTHDEVTYNRMTGGNPKPFVYKPSRSPVKIPLGSLFVNRSPGKMTAFENLGNAYLSDSPSKVRGSRVVVDSLSEIDIDTPRKKRSPYFGPLPTENRSVHVEREKACLWNGEESEIAREALLALSGVRSSLNKLLGRLLMPQTLPRPATVHILSSIACASEGRSVVEGYVFMIIKKDVEIPKDPVSRAFAHGIKGILAEIDKELVNIEMQGVKSWMQPVGLKIKDGVGARGAEFHGMGMSILQLEHATADLRSIIVFLASYFEDRASLTDFGHDYDAFPNGKELLEFLHKAAQQFLDGMQAEIAKRLFMAALVPYISLISRWAFGVESLTNDDYFAEPLSSEFSISALKGTLGPVCIPSIFSFGTRKDLIVSGTQLRLLYLWKRGSEFNSDLLQLNPHGSGRDTLGCGFSWFDGYPEPPSDGYLHHSCRKDRPIGSSRLNPMANLHVFENMLDVKGESISVLLESTVGRVLRRQSRLVSQACINLFVDQIKAIEVINFLRNSLMGFAGDFTSEFVRNLDASVFSLEPISANRANSAVFVACTNSCLKYSPHAKLLAASLVPKGENAINLVEDAFSYSPIYSDAIRIKSPNYSSMTQVLVPPVGHDAYDCIHVTFRCSGPLGAIISDDTLTAYSSILSMNVRLRRAILALECIERAIITARSTWIRCDFELPWAERFKTFRAFCFSCHRHLLSVQNTYRDYCSGNEWELVQRAFSESSSETKDGDISIHKLVQIHKRYVYQAAGRIVSEGNSPASKRGLEIMVTAIIDVRNTIENALRTCDHSIQRVFEDPSHWYDIKRSMLVYEGAQIKGKSELRKYIE
jgi:hypothetical protein